MPTIEQQLNELVKQKNALEDSLKSKGVEIGENETLNTLVEKVDNLETGGGGTSVGFNIHYGDTAPEDTSMLWVKCDEPSGVIINPSIPNPDSIVEMSTFYINDWCMASAVVGTDIYLFGGEEYPRRIRKFDTITETITILNTEIGTSCYGMASAVVGTDIYLFGGLGSSNSYSNVIYKFDTITETITTLSTKIPYAAGYMASAVVGTDIYLFGGYNVGYSTDYSTKICKFDTKTETITTLSTVLPYIVWDGGAEAIGTDIYIFFSNAICKFDTLTQTIMQITSSLQNARYIGDSTVSIGTDIYIIGGNPNYGYIQRFDTLTQSCVYKNILPYKLQYMSAQVIGTTIYAFGGYESSGIQTSSHSYKYTDMQLNNNELLIISNSSFNLCDILIGDVRINTGISNVYRGNSYDIGKPIDAYLYKNGAWTLIE